jgi:hypothetical protein
MINRNWLLEIFELDASDDRTTKIEYQIKLKYATCNRTSVHRYIPVGWRQ